MFHGLVSRNLDSASRVMGAAGILLLSSLLALASAPVNLQAQSFPGVRLDRSGEVARYRAEMLQDVTETIREWEKAWIDRDAGEITELYTEDGVFLPIEADRMARGSNGLSDLFAELLPVAGPINMQIADFEISGNQAFLLGRFSYTDLSQSPSPDIEGTYTMMLRRDGREWKIRAQMFRAE